MIKDLHMLGKIHAYSMESDPVRVQAGHLCLTGRRQERRSHHILLNRTTNDE